MQAFAVHESSNENPYLLGRGHKLRNVCSRLPNMFDPSKTRGQRQVPLSTAEMCAQPRLFLTSHVHVLFLTTLLPI